MKKAVFFILTIGLVFFLGACNDPSGGGGGDATDVTWDWGSGYRADTDRGETYMGFSIPLSGAVTITGKFGDIALYNQVILDAALYADSSAEYPVAEASGLGSFKLIPSEGGWTEQVSPQVDNMKNDGETSGLFSATLKPTHLLVQTKKDETNVGSILIRKLTLKLNAGIPTFTEAYNNSGGIYMDINGNKITFKNATYEDAAVRYDFPKSVVDAGFEGKTVYITWHIESFDSSKSYQIQVQAANGSKDYNGRHNEDSNKNPQVGQFYFILNNKAEPGPAKGVITLSGASLKAATAFNSDGDPNFPLTAIRINNNGKSESDVGQMEKSYTLVIDSIEVR
ncbi:MAG: hypothetical protein LBI28_09170 [Treponema sp.]|jgi:hypothetical protein|nr:hypothetical protein [Treponema sp.]